jgi:hypothetical protein
MSVVHVRCIALVTQGGVGEVDCSEELHNIVSPRPLAGAWAFLCEASSHLPGNMHSRCDAPTVGDELRCSGRQEGSEMAEPHSPVETIQEARLAEISDALESAPLQEIVRWAVETYRDQLTVATAFGAEGCCLIAMIAQVRDETGLTPAIFNLDTGYQFPATLELRERLQERYSLVIRLVSASETVEYMEARFGGPIYDSNPDHCCYVRKVIPFQTAVRGGLYGHQYSF